MKGQFASTIGRWLAAPLSRSSRVRRMTCTCRHVAKGTGSHGLGDNSNGFSVPNHSSSTLNTVYSRAFHASPARHQPSDDFAIRAQQFGLASKEEVALAAEDPSTVFLDVRSPPEIEDTPLTSRPCVKIWCTMGDTSRLLKESEQLMPDKDGEFLVWMGRTNHTSWPNVFFN